MSELREQEVMALLDSRKMGETATLIKELLGIRRERYRDKLESIEDAVVRGKARECKELLSILS